MSIEVKFDIKDQQRFQDAINRAKAATEDLRVPLTLIAKRWFKGNQAIFQLGSPGKYVDLSANYKKTKMQKYGFIYPILKATGALASSITEPTDPNAISEIVNKDTLLLGTRIEYGVYHQSDSGRSRLPRRPFLFAGDEAFAPESMRDNPKIWLEILNNFVLQKLKQEVGK